MLIHFEDNKEEKQTRNVIIGGELVNSTTISLFPWRSHWKCITSSWRKLHHVTARHTVWSMGLFYFIYYYYYWLSMCYCGDAFTIKKLREELSRSLVEAKEGDINEEGIEIESFDKLVKDMTSKREDIKAFAFKTKAMVSTRNHSWLLYFVSTSFYLCWFVVCCFRSLMGCRGWHLVIVSILVLQLTVAIR